MRRGTNAVTSFFISPLDQVCTGVVPAGHRPTPASSCLAYPILTTSNPKPMPERASIPSKRSSVPVWRQISIDL